MRRARAGRSRFAVPSNCEGQVPRGSAPSRAPGDLANSPARPRPAGPRENTNPMSDDSTADTQAAPAASIQPRPVVGERYEILGLLGAGGMGNVYKARDIELDELCALKVLRPELLGRPDALERFRREVKLARRV